MPTEIDARISTIGNLVIVTGTLADQISEYNFNSLVSKVYSFDILYEQSALLEDLPLAWPFMDSTNGNFDDVNSYLNLPKINILRDEGGEDVLTPSVIYSPQIVSLIGDTIVQFKRDIDHPSKQFSLTQTEHKVRFMLIGRK